MMRRRESFHPFIARRAPAARTGWGAVFLAVALAACNPPAPAPAAPGSNAEHGELERALFQRVNEYRDSVNLPRLRYDERLAAIAREHSRNMAAGTVPFSHEGYQRRTGLALLLGYGRLGENVAFNEYTRESTIEIAIIGLVGSPTHRHTMEGDWRHSGVGVARSERGMWYYTQLFAR